MRRAQLVSLAAVAAVCLAAPGAAFGSGRGAFPDASPALWSNACDWTAFGQIDPIVSYGATSMHMHTFVGAGNPSSTMQPEDLQDQVAHPTSCNGPITHGITDDSAYWVPSLFTATAIPNPYGIKPNGGLIYYRNSNVDPTTIQPFPHKLVMIAGDAKATEVQSDEVVVWSCVSPRHGSDQHELNFQATIPDTCPMVNAHGDPYTLRLVVYFPNCISEQGDLEHGQFKPDTKHYASKDASIPGDYKYHCTTPGEYPIPQLQVGFRWPLNSAEGLQPDSADPTSWNLRPMRIASDNLVLDGGLHSGTHGMTAHVDFMSGWTQPDLNYLVDHCFHTPQNCGIITDYDDN
jgi:hypothetical protein